MVWAFFGDSTMTRSTFPSPLPTAGAARGARFLATAALLGWVGDAFFLRPDVTGAAPSADCFLRAGTGHFLVVCHSPLSREYRGEERG